ncbi:hypothetical protein OKW41_006299 [Paraburkholderia sp. UCT70]|uniref:hypothetical protein n=1 Tax=Paraburkholderia sp. UCT70 TaxID=2991068 RepID=UPI003D19C455
MNAPFLISQTAEQSGYGSDYYKVVRGLTEAEIEAARAGTPVYFRADRSSRGALDTNWRTVRVHGKQTFPRVPKADAVTMLRKQTGLL